MPIDLDCTDPMYLLGRVAATIEGPWTSGRRSRVSDGPELDVLLVHPAKGFGLLHRRFGERMSLPEVAEMIDILPALPKGPVPIEQQGPYWMGYYHQRGQDRRDAVMVRRFTPERVRQVGELLFGLDHWQSEMTRELGLGDSSRVRAWISENPAKRRRVPPGVCRDLLAMLRQASAETKSVADEMDGLDADDFGSGDDD